MSGSSIIPEAYDAHKYTRTHMYTLTKRHAYLPQHNRMKAFATFDALQENGKKDLKFNEFLFLRTPACHIKEDICLICQGGVVWGTRRGGRGSNPNWGVAEPRLSKTLTRICLCLFWCAAAKGVKYASHLPHTSTRTHTWTHTHTHCHTETHTNARQHFA